jgi:hypothetical protein
MFFIVYSISSLLISGMLSFIFIPHKYLPMANAIQLVVAICVCNIYLGKKITNFRGG